MKKKSIWLLIICLVFLVACNKEDNKVKNQGENDTDTVNQQEEPTIIYDDYLSSIYPIRTVSKEDLLSVTAEMTYGDLLVLLGRTQDQGDLSPVAIYRLTSGEEVKIPFEAFTDLIGKSGDSLYVDGLVTLDDLNQETFRVVVDILNVRADADIDSDLVGKVKFNDQLVILNSKADRQNRIWYYIEMVDGQKGWLASWYTRLLKENQELGQYVSIEDTLAANPSKTQVDTPINLPDVSDILRGDQIPPLYQVPSQSKHIERLDKVLLYYAYYDDLKVNQGHQDIYLPMLMANSKLLFWLEGQDKGVRYLCRRDLENQVLEVIYVYENPDHQSIEVMNYNLNHVFYKVDQEIIVYSTEENRVISHKSYKDLPKVVSISSDGKSLVFEMEDVIFISDSDLTTLEPVAQSYFNTEDEVSTIATRYPQFSPTDPNHMIFDLIGYEAKRGTAVYRVDKDRVSYNGDSWGGRYLNSKYMDVSDLMIEEGSTYSLKGLVDMKGQYITFGEALYVSDHVKFNQNPFVFLLDSDLNMIMVNPDTEKTYQLTGLDQEDKVYATSPDGKWLITYSNGFKIYKLR